MSCTHSIGFCFLPNGILVLIRSKLIMKFQRFVEVVQKKGEKQLQLQLQLQRRSIQMWFSQAFPVFFTLVNRVLCPSEWRFGAY